MLSEKVLSLGNIEFYCGPVYLHDKEVIDIQIDQPYAGYASQVVRWDDVPKLIQWLESQLQNHRQQQSQDTDPPSKP